MSRSVRVELSPRNVALLLGALVLFAALIIVAMRLLQGQHAPHALPGDAHGAGDATREEQRPARLELSPAALANAQIELLTAGPGEVSVTLSLPGEVSLNQERLAHVTPRVAGAAREVRRQVGELVQKGTVLAIIDSRDLADVQREYFAAQERLALAKSTFERAELLKRENISADKDYLEARQALAEAQIEHRSAGQKLKAIGGLTKGGGYELVAPLTGTIIEKHINVGEVLREDTRVFTIADLSSIWVNVTVYARDLPRVAVGQAVEVRAEGIAEPARASITYLGQVVGEQTRSATARIVLDNPGPAWRPGLFVTADVVIERGPAAVVVVDAAVMTLEGQQVVFVQEGNAFEARVVRLGRRGTAASNPGQSTSGSAAPQRVLEVLEGVSAGERYAGKNSFTLKAELGKSEAGHEH